MGGALDDDEIFIQARGYFVVNLVVAYNRRVPIASLVIWTHAMISCASFSTAAPFIKFRRALEKLSVTVLFIDKNRTGGANENRCNRDF